MSYKQYLKNLKEASEQINNPDYKFYVVANGVIHSGWEYIEDAKDDIKELEENGLKARVYQRFGLKKLGLSPDNNSDWGNAYKTNKVEQNEGIFDDKDFNDREEPENVETIKYEKIEPTTDEEGSTVHWFHDEEVEFTDNIEQTIQSIIDNGYEDFLYSELGSEEGIMSPDEKIVYWGSDIQDYLRKHKVNENENVTKIVDPETVNPQEINKLIKAPYVNAMLSTLGGKDRASLLIKFSLDPKEKWANNILQNSRWGMFHLNNNGSLELSHGKIKFRKTKVTSLEDAINKINAAIENQSTTESWQEFKNKKLNEWEDDEIDDELNTLLGKVSDEDIANAPSDDNEPEEVEEDKTTITINEILNKLQLLARKKPIEYNNMMTDWRDSVPHTGKEDVFLKSDKFQGWLRDSGEADAFMKDLANRCSSLKL